MKRCKHKNTSSINEDIGGYNIPDYCLCEYDVLCNDCNKIIGWKEDE